MTVLTLVVLSLIISPARQVSQTVIREHQHRAQVLRLSPIITETPSAARPTQIRTRCGDTGLLLPGNKSGDWKKNFTGKTTFLDPGDVS